MKGALMKLVLTALVLTNSFCALAKTELVSEVCSDVFAYKGEAYFCANHATMGKELFRTNGTTSGTNVVFDIDPGPGSSTPKGLFEFRGYLYFFAENTLTGRSLWRTDGTKKGTKRIKTIPKSYSGASNLVPIVARKEGQVFFQADGDSLWRSDGSALGTYILTNDVTNGFSSSSNYIPATTYHLDGEQLYYLTLNRLNKIEINTRVSQLIKEFSRSEEGVYTAKIISTTNQDDYFYIMHSDDSTGGGSELIAPDNGLWRSDGTISGTQRLHSSLLFIVGELNGRFVACDRNTQTLVKLTATSRETLKYNANEFPCSSSSLSAVNSKLIILQYVESENNHGLWAFDLEGSTIEKLFSDLIPYNGAVLGKDRLYFSDSAKLLYSSNASSAGTFSFFRLPNQVFFIRFVSSVRDNKFYFIAYDRSIGSSGLWVSDGTSSGTKKVKNLPSDFYNAKSWFEGHRLYWHDEQKILWHTDGSAAGTYRLRYRLLDADDPNLEEPVVLITPVLDLLLGED